MKGSIYIALDYAYDFELDKINITSGINGEDYSIDVNVLSSESFLDVIYDKANIDEMMDSLHLYNELIEEDNNILKQIEKTLLSGDDKVINLFNCERVYIYGATQDINVLERIKLYIMNNPYLLTKEIIVQERLQLSYEALDTVKKIFGEIKNIKFAVEGNEHALTIEEFEKTLLAIDEIVSKIKQYNYSPFESLIYAYDLVRDRFYLEEDANEKEYISRDISSVLFGEKIVCVGFANIFNIIAQKLGLKSILYFLIKDNAPGHVRNLIYLTDEKYDINGLYFFDPTWDCKKNDNNEFLSSYMFFAKSYFQIMRMTSRDYVKETYDYFDYCNVYDFLEEYYDKKLNFFDLINIVTKSKINVMLKFIDEKEIDVNSSYTGDEINEAMEKISSMADQCIEASKFIRALYTVRRNQYYENPSKYLFDIDTLTEILVNSKLVSNTPENKLLAAIFFEEINVGSKTARDIIEKYIEDNNLECDIERVKLSRLLRSIYEKKVNAEKKLEKKI